MKTSLLRLEFPFFKGLMMLVLCMGAAVLSSCSDDKGLTEGDPNYFTTSRGQFTATLSDGTTLYLIPGVVEGTATVTFDGDKPLHWQSQSISVSVTTYQGDLVIPETVTGSDGNTYTITAIGEEAFMGCRELTSVQLPSTVQTLGEGAFAICIALTNANIPEGVAELPVGCFGYCRALTSVTLPSTLKIIGKMAFYGCEALTDVNIPEGVTELPVGCFGYCSALNAVTLPSTLKSIGKMAFYGCEALETGSFTLPEGLETIGEHSFSECTGKKFTEIIIPSTVTRIGDKAFGGRKSGYCPRIAKYHMKATTPPALDGVLYQARDGVNPVIKVPAGAKEAYQSAAGWSSLTIEEE